MKILIAGGSGLIGHALVSEALNHGHDSIILSRSPEKVEKISTRVKVVGWDSKTASGWAGVLDEVDAVVNLAGAPLNGDGPLDLWLTNKRKEGLVKSRMNATKALIEGIQGTDNKPEVFVQASAIGYYGPLDDQIVSEEHAPGDDFLASVQIRHEKSTEILDSMGIRRIILRTGLVFAEEDSPLDYFKLQFYLLAGGRMGSGEQYYSWIHIKDEAAAILFLIEHETAHGPYNLVSPNPVMNKEFAKTMGKVMKRPSFFIIPRFLLKMVLGEVSTVVLDGQRVSSNKLESLGFEFRYPDLESALEDVL